MKKDYSKIFGHYYGLEYNGNSDDVIKVHQLMEDAGISVSGSTKSKLAMYSDKRPFKVHYFISRIGSRLKWCPTSSKDKLCKMTLKPASWWIEQLTDVAVTTSTVELPKNWLDVQLTEHVKSMIDSTTAIGGNSSYVLWSPVEPETQEEECTTTVKAVDEYDDDDELPF